MCSLVTLGPIGYAPAPGTITTIICVPIYALLFQLIPIYAQLLWALGFTLFAILVLHAIREYMPLNDDPSYIVIDEMVGSLWASVGILWALDTVMIAVIVFRFFDITKLLGICTIECLLGSIGIVADDVLAGIYACLAVQVYQLVYYGF